MKPKLKPPGTKRLKLNCDILLSTSALKLKLRRYILDEPTNHLDLESVEALIEGLNAFRGRVAAGLGGICIKRWYRGQMIGANR